MSEPRQETQAERQLVFSVLKAALQAMGSVVGKHTELVLHDLSQPEKSVVAIVNGHVTGRRIGSPVLAGLHHDQGFAAVQQAPDPQAPGQPVVTPAYDTTGANGKTLRSATAVYRDAQGQPFASLCINADLSGIRTAQACLAQLLGDAPQAEPSTDEPADMALMMNDIIQSALGEACGSGRPMNKQAKLAAVRQMQERGLFIVKGGIEKAAAALGVTRYTIYNYLEAIRRPE
ncbi:transcriptional regulator [Paludibacterium sp. B53371]|uniref:helix-turn-helix transcriptional regulator n=1 Tax=Paludibacterium sp. B53371 TaxID=2806263 RepID=UPI00207B967B|nr:PAS domain-containing protein [Paludibacterium sp. B53371]